MISDMEKIGKVFDINVYIEDATKEEKEAILKVLKELGSCKACELREKEFLRALQV